VGLLQSLLVGGGALGTVVSSDTGSFVPAYFGSFGAEDAAQSTLTTCADTVLLSETGTAATTTAAAGTAAGSATGTAAGTAATGSSGAAGTAAAGADVYSYADDDVDGCCAGYASQSSDVATVAAAPPQLQGILALLVARVVAVGHALAAASKASHSSTTADSTAVHRDANEQSHALRVSQGFH
jgi:hypothetical protein